MWLPKRDTLLFDGNNPASEHQANPSLMIVYTHNC